MSKTSILFLTSTMITTILFVAKATGLWRCSWWLVFAPIWGLFVAFLIVFAFLLFSYFIGKIVDRIFG